MLKAAFLTLLIFAAALTTAAQQKIVGPIIDVIDGRTVVIDLQTVKLTAILQNIEVPEPGQQFRDVAKNHLRDLVIGKTATFRPLRLLSMATTGRLEVDGIDMSQQMLRDGVAWLIPIESSSQDPTEFDVYRGQEASAKSDKRGIWSVPGLNPPWEFRAEVARRQQQEYDVQYRQSSYGRPVRGSTVSDTSRGKSVGALLSSFDPKTRTGYIATPMLGITGLESRYEWVIGGFAYSYTEDLRKSKKGRFLLAIDYAARERQTLFFNKLAVYVDGINIGTIMATRTVRRSVSVTVVRTSYSIDRRMLERIANSNQVYLVNGYNYLYLSPGLQMVIYNLLDAAK